MWRRSIIGMLIAGAVAAASGAAAQTQSRVATTRALLLANSLFFHSRTVAITDTPRLIDGVWRLPSDANKHLIVIFRGSPGSDRAVEIRGTFVDVGRFAPEDSRVTAFELRGAVDAVLGAGAQWPARDTFFAIVGATTTPAEEPAQAPSLRMLAMFPEKFEGKPVKVRGRFRGRNLVGDLPSWPRQTEHDFVLQAADGAVWVTGVRPRGKGFDLDPQARRDLGRWLEISGTVTIAGGLPMIRATAVAQSTPEDDTTAAADTAPPPPPPPPPAITFSIPGNEETAVATDSLVRVQFNRDMKAETFDGRVKVTAVVNGASVAAPEMTLTYRPGTLSMELKFAAALPRFATITIDFQAGITAPDGTALPPSKLTFYTGG
ncbi:MAG: hypothetical protein EPO35_10600 [Acidobacteria bacterium]|nr:MAG: hypothetical protein EPO35_10600 [Acidobacteriota bacterium]